MNSGATSANMDIGLWKATGTGLPVTIGTSATTIVALNATVDQYVRALWVGNIHASATASLTLYLIVSGGTEGATNQMGGAVDYAVKTLVEELNGSYIRVPAGYLLRGIASAANSIVVTPMVQIER